MFTGIIFSFASGILTVFFGIIFRFAGVKYEFKNTILCYSIFSALLIGGWSLISFESWATFSIVAAVLSALSGFINISGLILLRKAMEIGNSGVAWAFCQASLIGPFLAGVIFYNERPSILQYIGVAAILGGLALLSNSDSNQEKSQEKAKYKYLLLAVGSFLFVCVNGSVVLTVSKIAPDFNIFIRSLFMQIGTIIMLGGVNIIKMSKFEVSKGMILTALGLCLFGVVSGLSMFVGINSLSAPEINLGGLAIPIVQGTAIGGFALYSRFFLKEKTDWIKWVGITLIILGIVFMM